MAQVAEHILGKDEVTSSNLVSSSIKIPEIKRFRGFLLVTQQLKTPGSTGGKRKLK